jgi:hypothetical protein
MKKDMLKKGVVTLALAGSFMIGLGAFDNANAQVRRRVEPQRNGGYGPIESTGNIDRNKNGIDDRYETQGQVDINRNGVPDSQENYGRFGQGPYDQRGNYDRFERNGRGLGNDGHYEYGNRSIVNNAEYQQGYRDGLSRGRDDARTNRAMTPNNSSHYRNGSASYRAGFERGFYEAYRQNRPGRW